MESIIAQAKAALRERIRDRLKEMSEAERAAASAQARIRVAAQTLWKSARSVLLYAPLPDELDVWPLLAAALTAGKTVALPGFDPATRLYLARQVRHLPQDLKTGQFGIREPNDDCVPIALERLDLALVPGMAFDRLGRRLGRGRGFLDQLLADVRGATCGVAFEEQIVSEVPAAPHDVRVTFLLTPARWLEPGNERLRQSLSDRPEA
jgi:5-formyltetrahydrofolate cyclo-ligase